MKRILAFTASVSLLFAGCGGGPLPGEAVAKAAARAEEMGTAKVFLESTTSMAQGEMRIVGDGAIDFERQLGHLTMTPSGAAFERAGAMAGDIEAVFADMVIYLRMAAFEQFMPQGKTWFKIDLQAVGEDMGFDFGQLQQLGQSDPSQQLEFLRAVSNVEETGSEEVRGVDTTHHSGTLDYDKVAEQFPEAAESIRRVQELSGVEKTPIDVWIDDEGLPRRISYTMTMKPPAESPAAGMNGTSTFLMEYFAYGTEVQVDLPPASEVLDPSKLKS